MRKVAKKKKSTSESYLLEQDSSFLMQEDYRALRTNIIFSLMNDGAKTIAVTSSNHAEGKSTTAINLAISFAQVEKKVLLIECDLRLPSISNKMNLNVSHMKGLSDVLVGTANLKESFIFDKKHNITIITSGTIPPDPTILLQSNKMEKLIGALREYYDYVILDCPPVGAVIDALLLAHVVDGYIFVVKHNETNMKSLTESLQKFERTNANLMGIIYTNSPVEKKGYYKKHYYKK